MCLSCWNERGKPQVDNALVRDIAGLVKDVFAHSSVGGGLHIVVEDWNLETEHIEWCLKEGGCSDLERRCGELMLTATEDERASALALVDGGWS